MEPIRRIKTGITYLHQIKHVGLAFLSLPRMAYK